LPVNKFIEEFYNINIKNYILFYRSYNSSLLYFRFVVYIILKYIKLSAKLLLIINYNLLLKKIFYVILFPSFSFP